MRAPPQQSVIALLLGTLLSSCGYDGVPLNAELSTRARLDGKLEQAVAAGFAEPDASTFPAGLLLYARFTVSRLDVRTVELLLDLERAILPEDLQPPQAPVVITPAADELRATVRYRLVSGRPRSEQTISDAQVIVRSARVDQLRLLLGGDLILVMPAADDVFTQITGTWETTPAAEVTALGVP